METESTGVFLPPHIVNAANESILWVGQGVPVFKKPARLVARVIRGSVLRYSTTTPKAGVRQHRSALPVDLSAMARVAGVA